MLLIYFILLLLVFLQSSFLTANILFAGVLALCFRKVDKNVITVIFLFGILFDILNINLLGISSLVYLFSAILVNLYRKRLKTKSLWYLTPVSLILFIVYAFFLTKNINILNIIIEVISLSVLYPIFSALDSEKEIIYDKK